MLLLATESKKLFLYSIKKSAAKLIRKTKEELTTRKKEGALKDSATDHKQKNKDDKAKMVF